MFVLVDGALKAQWLESRLYLFPNTIRLKPTVELFSKEWKQKEWTHVVAPYTWWKRQQQSAQNDIDCEIQTLVLLEIPECERDSVFQNLKQTYPSIRSLVLYFETVWDERRFKQLAEEMKQPMEDVKQEESVWNVGQVMPRLHTLYIRQDRRSVLPFELMARPTDKYDLIQICSVEDQSIQLFFQCTDWFFFLQEEAHELPVLPSHHSNTIMYSIPPKEHHVVLPFPNHDELENPEPFFKYLKYLLENQHPPSNYERVVTAVLDVPDRERSRELHPVRCDLIQRRPVLLDPSEFTPNAEISFWERTFRVWSSSVTVQCNDPNLLLPCSYLILGKGSWNQSLSPAYGRQLLFQLKARNALELVKRGNGAFKDFYQSLLERLLSEPVLFMFVEWYFTLRSLILSNVSLQDELNGVAQAHLAHPIQALCAPSCTKMRILGEAEEKEEINLFLWAIFNLLPSFSMTQDYFLNRKCDVTFASLELCNALQTLILTCASDDTRPIKIRCSCLQALATLYIIYELSLSNTRPMHRQIFFRCVEEQPLHIPNVVIHATPFDVLDLRTADTSLIGIGTLHIYVNCEQEISWLPRLYSQVPVQHVVWKFCFPNRDILDLGISEQSQLPLHDARFCGYTTPIGSHDVWTLRNAFANLVFGLQPASLAIPSLPEHLRASCFLQPKLHPTLASQKIQLVVGVGHVRLNHPPACVEELRLVEQVAHLEDIVSWNKNQPFPYVWFWFYNLFLSTKAFFHFAFQIPEETLTSSQNFYFLMWWILANKWIDFVEFVMMYTSPSWHNSLVWVVFLFPFYCFLSRIF